MTRASLKQRLARLEEVVPPIEAGPIKVAIYYCDNYYDPDRTAELGTAEPAQVVELPPHPDGTVELGYVIELPRRRVWAGSQAGRRGFGTR